MKKTIAGLLSLLLLVGILTGCAGNPDSITSTQPRPQLDTALIRDPIPASAVFAGGDGSEENPFQIDNAQQLERMIRSIDQPEDDGTYSRAHYILTSDIRLNDTTDWENWDTNAPEFQWYPNRNVPFSGVFDGNGHTIYGIYCYGPVADSEEPDALGLGLFSSVVNGEIRNLSIRKSYFHNVDTAKSGAIAASATNSRIFNCVNEAIVSGPSSVACGGIVGKMTGTVKNCTNRGTVYGQGGIAGICFGSLFSCRNEAPICYEEGSADVGGIAGGLYGGNFGSTAANCINTGEVRSGAPKSRVGGLFGSVYAGKQLVRVEDCLNSGSVIAANEAGGAVGAISSITDDTSSVTVSWVTNEGTLTAGNSAGGICSSIYAHDSGAVTMHGCQNRGALQSSDSGESTLLGGVIGSMTLTGHADISVLQCVNQADIQGCAAGMGGIVSQITAYAEEEKQTNIYLTECKNRGNLSGTAYGMGGIAGLVTLLEWKEGNLIEIQGCLNSGEICHRSAGETNYLGGIAGNFMAYAGSETIAIADCRNSGDVLYDAADLQMPENAEGISRSFGHGIVAGFHENGVISDCENTGEVQVINGDARWMICQTQFKNPDADQSGESDTP